MPDIAHFPDLKIAAHAPLSTSTQMEFFAVCNCVRYVKLVGRGAMLPQSEQLSVDPQ
jgi:hypothetical protein